MELADTSAWTSKHKSASIESDFQTRIVEDDIATCPMVVMELLWTARSPGEFAELRDDLGALPQLPIDARIWSRAIDVWQMLVEDGRHRQAKIADLLVAAAAEVAGIPVCHYNADFDAIASVTGQPVRAIAPLGTL